MYSEDSPYLEFPILDTYESYLLNLWYESGCVSQGGMGISTLSWSEIIVWAERFYNLLDHELVTIRFISKEYATEFAQTEKDVPFPREIVREEIDVVANSSAIEDALKKMFVEEN